MSDLKNTDYELQNYRQLWENVVVSESFFFPVLIHVPVVPNYKGDVLSSKNNSFEWLSHVKMIEKRLQELIPYFPTKLSFIVIIIMMIIIIIFIISFVILLLQKQVKHEADQVEIPSDLITSVTEAAAAVVTPAAPPPPPLPPLPPPAPDGMCFFSCLIL